MNRQAGFSLVEMLVAAAIFGLTVVGAFTLYATNQNAYRHGQSKASVQQNARVALQLTSRELRVAGFDLSGVLATLSSPTPIQVANLNSLTFVADLDRDGTLDQIGYRLQGTRLIREVSSWNGSSFPAPVGSDVAEGLSQLVFTYYDDTAPVNTAFTAPVAAASLGDIHRVTIGIVASDSTVGIDEQFSHVIDVRLRN